MENGKFFWPKGRISVHRVFKQEHFKPEKGKWKIDIERAAIPKISISRKIQAMKPLSPMLDLNHSLTGNAKHSDLLMDNTIVSQVCNFKIPRIFIYAVLL